jgi:hypothetical protein
MGPANNGSIDPALSPIQPAAGQLMPGLERADPAITSVGF